MNSQNNPIWDAYVAPALTAYQLGNLHEAEVLLKEHLGDLRHVLQSRQEVLGEMYCLLANVERDQDNFTEALNQYQNAIDASQAISKKKDKPLPRIFQEMALCYLLSGDFEQAIKLEQKSLPILSKYQGKHRFEYMSVLFRLGAIGWISENYSLSEHYYKKAFREFFNALGATDARLIPVLNALALLSYRQGKFKDSEDYYRQALEIERTCRCVESQTLNGLGMALCAQGENRNARRYCQKASQLREAVNRNDTINELADVFCEHDRFAEAAELCEDALCSRERLPGETKNLLGNLRMYARLIRETNFMLKVDKVEARIERLQAEHETEAVTAISV